VTTGNVVFLIILVLAAGFFAYSAQRLYAFMTRVGKPEDRSNDPGRASGTSSPSASRRPRSCATRWPGCRTRSVFWGFMVITLGTAR
jgi:hypothetical protein